MKTVIVTHYAPMRAEHKIMFDLAKSVNSRWAQSLGWDFAADESRRVKSEYRERAAFLVEAIAGLQDGDRALWLDGDALIVANPESIWTDLGNNDIGLVKFVYSRWNVGVAPMIVNPVIRNLWVEIRDHTHEQDKKDQSIHEVWDANTCADCPLKPGDRGPICGSHKIKLVELGHRWNEQHDKIDNETRIVGHHGLFDHNAKLRAMQETVAALCTGERIAS